jgi:hypothetical protein
MPHCMPIGEDRLESVGASELCGDPGRSLNALGVSEVMTPPIESGFRNYFKPTREIYVGTIGNVNASALTKRYSAVNIASTPLAESGAIQT